MRIPALSVFFLLMLVSCSSPPPPPDHSYPVGPLTFAVRRSSLHGAVPAGWFSPAGDTLTPSLVAWLVNDDHSSSISLRELSLDLLTQRRVRKDGMRLLAILSMTFRGEPSKDEPAAGTSTFIMNGSEYGRYEINAGGLRSCVIVFARDGKYYECEARQHRASQTEQEMQQLRRIQAAVLASLAE